MEQKKRTQKLIKEEINKYERKIMGHCQHIERKEEA